jgi:hypothetical protein
MSLVTAGQSTTWAIVALATLGVIVRPWRLPEAIWAVLGAMALVVLALLPWTSALQAIGKGTDVYLFLLGMMLLAELARKEGLFYWLAALAVRQARGSTDAEQLTRQLSKPRNDRVAVGPEDHFHVSCRCRLIEGTIDNPPSGKVPYGRRHQRDTQTTGNEARQRICLYNLLRDARDEARFDAAVAKVLGKARVFETEEHMVVVSKIRETQTAVLREAMAPRKSDPDLLAPSDFSDELGIVGRASEKADIGLPGMQGSELGERRHLMQPHQYFRILAIVSADDRRERAQQHGASGADVELSGLARADRPRLFDRLPDLPQNRSCAVEERGAGRRQLDPAAGAQKQRSLQLRFEILDLLTERRLGDPQPISRRGKAQLLGHGQEISQVTKLHRYLLGQSILILY